MAGLSVASLAPAPAPPVPVPVAVPAWMRGRVPPWLRALGAATYSVVSVVGPDLLLVASIVVVLLAWAILLPFRVHVALMLLVVGGLCVVGSLLALAARGLPRLLPAPLIHALSQWSFADLILRKRWYTGPHFGELWSLFWLQLTQEETERLVSTLPNSVRPYVAAPLIELLPEPVQHAVQSAAELPVPACPSRRPPRIAPLAIEEGPLPLPSALRAEDPLDPRPEPEEEMVLAEDPSLDSLRPPVWSPLPTDSPLPAVPSSAPSPPVPTDHLSSLRSLAVSYPRGPALPLPRPSAGSSSRQAPPSPTARAADPPSSHSLLPTASEVDKTSLLVWEFADRRVRGLVSSVLRSYYLRPLLELDPSALHTVAAAAAGTLAVQLLVSPRARRVTVRLVQASAAGTCLLCLSGSLGVLFLQYLNAPSRTLSASPLVAAAVSAWTRLSSSSSSSSTPTRLPFRHRVLRSDSNSSDDAPAVRPSAAGPAAGPLPAARALQFSPSAARSPLGPPPPFSASAQRVGPAAVLVPRPSSSASSLALIVRPRVLLSSAVSLAAFAWWLRRRAALNGSDSLTELRALFDRLLAWLRTLAQHRSLPTSEGALSLTAPSAGPSGLGVLSGLSALAQRGLDRWGYSLPQRINRDQALAAVGVALFAVHLARRLR